MKEIGHTQHTVPRHQANMCTVFSGAVFDFCKINCVKIPPDVGLGHNPLQTVTELIESLALQEQKRDFNFQIENVLLVIQYYIDTVNGNVR